MCGIDYSIVVDINSTRSLPGVIQPVAIRIRATRRASSERPATRCSDSNCLLKYLDLTITGVGALIYASRVAREFLLYATQDQRPTRLAIAEALI